MKVNIQTACSLSLRRHYPHQVIWVSSQPNDTVNQAPLNIPSAK